MHPAAVALVAVLVVGIIGASAYLLTKGNAQTTGTPTLALAQRTPYSPHPCPSPSSARWTTDASEPDGWCATWTVTSASSLSMKTLQVRTPTEGLATCTHTPANRAAIRTGDTLTCGARGYLPPGSSVRFTTTDGATLLSPILR